MLFAVALCIPTKIHSEYQSDRTKKNTFYMWVKAMERRTSTRTRKRTKNRIGKDFFLDNY